jgi:cyclomaltodextrinase
MTHWANSAVFYHIYPLGLCGAPAQNTLSNSPQNRLNKLIPWFDHAQTLGANALLLGPIMESGSHGYDIKDYFHIDQRLGDQSAMLEVASEARARGLKVVLDGVFHHVGREFWAFRDVLEKGQESRFVDWFYLDFDCKSPFDDPFSYQSWDGCFDLVKLNLGNSEVRGHLFDAVSNWIRDFQIDGLRLDAADRLDMGFMRDLGALCRGLNSDFWLMGEVVHGPYSRWLDEGELDSVTNYECYKGLYSSFNDLNFFEIAHTLREHFGEKGIYRSASLFSFVDNHDVERVASRLNDPAHLYPLYCLLLTMPGTPAIYYGSEFALNGVKSHLDDWSLRPELTLRHHQEDPLFSDLTRAITRLIQLRTTLPALQEGDYQELFLDHRRLVFSRRTSSQWVIVALSSEKSPEEQEVILPEPIDGWLVDLFNPGQKFEIKAGKSIISPLWPCWGRVMEVQKTA